MPSPGSLGKRPDLLIPSIWAVKPDLVEIRKIYKEIGLSLPQQELAHEELHKLGGNYSLEEIREIAEEIKKLYPKK